MPPNPKFSKGDKVLCIEDQLIQEAQCLEVKITEDGVVKYLIHYIGWHERWDEWVLENRVMEYSNENLLLQKEVYKAYRAKLSPTKGKLTDIIQPTLTQDTDAMPSTSGQCSDTSPRTSKRKYASLQASSSSGSETEMIEQPPRTCIINLPEELKNCLADDRFYITKQQMLTNLPACLTVAEIIDAYGECKTSSGDVKSELYPDVIKTLRDSFDVMLLTLLYKFEQPQYEQVLKENPKKLLSETYGAIHLLRLFVQLGIIFKDKEMGGKGCLDLLEASVQDFLNYLIYYSSALFNFEAYGIPSPDYFHLRCEKKYRSFDNVPIPI